jgi:S1-C subfamily serine protease
MEFSQKLQVWSREASQASMHALEGISETSNEVLHSKYAAEALGAAVVVAVIASRGKLAGLVEKAGLPSARTLCFGEKLTSEAGALESIAPSSFAATRTIDSIASSPGTAARTIDSIAPSSFAARSGIRSASSANGKWFDFGSYPNADRNSELFHREISEKLGVDLEKMREGKVAILYPRFKTPEKQLLGKVTGAELGLWGSKEQGVGVVQYESLPSTKGYLKAADSVVRITQRTEDSLPANFASHAGSGVLVGRPEQGLVLTNEHVVNSAATIAVETVHGEKFAARVVAIHPDQDMAMLQITDAPPNTNFPVATLDDPSSAMLNKTVGALGHHGALPGLIASTGKYESYHELFKLDVFTLDSMTKGGSGGGIFGQDGRLVSLVTKQLDASDQAVVKRSFVGGINIKHIRGFIDKVDTMLKVDRL